MAAVTGATIKNEFSFANKRAVLAQITTIADTNTWDTPLKNVTAFFVTPNDAAYVGGTVGTGSNTNRITFQVSGTLTDSFVLVIGD